MVVDVQIGSQKLLLQELDTVYMYIVYFMVRPLEKCYELKHFILLLQFV